MDIDSNDRDGTKGRTRPKPDTATSNLIRRHKAGYWTTTSVLFISLAVFSTTEVARNAGFDEAAGAFVFPYWLLATAVFIYMNQPPLIDRRNPFRLLLNHDGIELDPNPQYPVALGIGISDAPVLQALSGVISRDDPEWHLVRYRSFTRDYRGQEMLGQELFVYEAQLSRSVPSVHASTSVRKGFLARALSSSAPLSGTSTRLDVGNRSFDDLYELTIEPGSSRAALQIIEPNIMAAIIGSKQHFDFELVENRLRVYGSRKLCGDEMVRFYSFSRMLTNYIRREASTYNHAPSTTKEIGHRFDMVLGFAMSALLFTALFMTVMVGIAAALGLFAPSGDFARESVRQRGLIVTALTVGLWFGYVVMIVVRQIAHRR